MINRVTQQTVQRSTLANVQLNLAKMADMQARMSSGKLITRPSDDPAGTATAMTLRSQTRAAEQFSRNADDGVGWLTTVDSSLSASVAEVRAARNLTVQGGKGSLNAVGREAIAIQLEGIRDELLAQANFAYLGRSVYAGTSDAGVAFTGAAAVPPYDWTGTAGATVQRRVSTDTTIRVDADGTAVFGAGTGSVFALIDSIAADLRAGVDVGPRLTEIDARMDTMLGQLSGAGTRYNQMTSAQDATTKAVMDLTVQLGKVEDIDLASTILDLEMQEVAYKGALGAAARVLQPTLMDFLR